MTLPLRSSLAGLRDFMLVVALAIGAPSAAAQSQRAAIPFQLVRMALDVRVDYDRAADGGTETLVLRNVTDQPAATIPLLLGRLMTVSRVTGAGGAELRYTQRVAIVEGDSMRQVNAVVITPVRPVSPGDSITIVVRFDGRLVGYTETGSLYIQDHIDRDFTILREDALAFPVVGVPSDAANRSAPRGPFAFTARVTVPAGQVVAMGGKHRETVSHDSLATWVYRSERPVPFLNIAIAPYRTLHRDGADIFYFSQDSSGARMVDDAIKNAVDRFTTWFGAVDGSLQLTVMEIPEGWGSQASLSGGIIETAEAFRDRGQLYQLYHELSHLWNADDLDAHSPRWNEGLASFLQWRMAAELDAWNGWDARIERIEKTLRNNCANGTICSSVPFVDYGTKGVTDLSYSVGTLLFYALYQSLGADRFDTTYRELFQTHRSGVTSGDLVDAFKRASPRSEKILRDWFLTTTWYDRLAAGESARAIIDSYVKP